MKHKKCIAMLLAGGQGSRLYALTNRLAKPGVSYGSKYRIIDFTLSNCINSGIDTVGVLTQYQPLQLHEYIGSGEPWDLDRFSGGVYPLPPYQAKSGAQWYKGTANAIYQNIRFIEKYNPEHVLILSGDHIYKMDYSRMLDFHVESNADCTISVIDVPPAEAPRFGILDYDKTGRITGFEEKPEKPKSNHASMGVYIFKTGALKAALTADEADPLSQNDFGKNIIPTMLREGKRMFGYLFDGYWKDVGTINSLWEANMDLLGSSPKLELAGDSRVYSRNDPLPPMYAAAGSRISGSIITAGCEIYGTVINSVLGEGVYVCKGALVKDSVLMEGSSVGENAAVYYSVIDENVAIGANAHISEDSGADVITLVSTSTEDGAVIKKGFIEGKGE